MLTPIRVTLIGDRCNFKEQKQKKLKIDIKDFSKLKFSDYFKNFKEYMNIVEYDELENLF